VSSHLHTRVKCTLPAHLWIVKHMTIDHGAAQKTTRTTPLRNGDTVIVTMLNITMIQEDGSLAGVWNVTFLKKKKKKVWKMQKHQAWFLVDFPVSARHNVPFCY